MAKKTKKSSYVTMKIIERVWKWLLNHPDRLFEVKPGVWEKRRKNG